MSSPLWAASVSIKKTDFMGQFSTLFEVRFYQRYYDAQTLRDLEIVPSSDTIRLLKSFQLMYRVTPESLVILFDEDKKFLLESQRTPITLSFGMRALNRHFETFTLLKPINKQTRYFLDNRNATRDGNLHAGDWLNDQASGAWFAAGEDPRVFLAEPALTISKEDRLVFDGRMETKFGWNLDDESGWYDFANLSGGATVRQYRLPDAFRMMWGVLDLVVGGEGALSFREVSGSRYQVRMDHRPVYWHYYFVSESGRLPAAVKIFSGKDLLAFTEPERVQLVNGQPAVRVISRDAYPLTARTDNMTITAQLSENQNEAGIMAPRVMSLPVADARRIKGTVTPSGEVYFWETFVYL